MDFYRFKLKERKFGLTFRKNCCIKSFPTDTLYDSIMLFCLNNRLTIKDFAVMKLWIELLSLQSPGGFEFTGCP